MKLFKQILFKILPILVCILFFSKESKANHVKGGEVFYTYLGPGINPNTSSYLVSLRLFRDCNQPCGGITGVACLPLKVTISIFENSAGYNRILDKSVTRTSITPITLTTYPPCITIKPAVCYEIGLYTFKVELIDNQVGYRFVFQTCCRDEALNELQNANTASFYPGATYEGVCPGKQVLPIGHNSSAVARLKDTALVCNFTQFQIDFGADDPDGDLLTYEFASAYNGGDKVDASDIAATKPPYGNIDYVFPYTGISPLGTGITINSQTGIISGTSPTAGQYVVCVLIKEWRNGINIGEHRKDFILKVEACEIPKPSLDPGYLTCDGFTLNFANQSNSNLIKTYYWDFGVAGILSDTANSKSVTYTYADTGIYDIALIINRGQQCTDTAYSKAKVYPGFFPGFQAIGNCVQYPYTFIDTTLTDYGNVDSWKWDFGDLTTLSDTSHKKTDIWTYPSTSTITAKLIVTNSKGCIDSISKPVDIKAGPDLLFKFNDTLICSIDTLRLNVSTTANAATFSWSPLYNLINPGAANPFVFPKQDTTYLVTVLSNGCTAIDSIKVRVVDKVFLSINNDTSMCLTDTLQLNSITNALYFKWNPVTSLNNATISNPYTIPTGNIEYILLASVGNCNASDTVIIKTAPYPIAIVGNDASICFGKTVQLNGSIVGIDPKWTPSNSLLNYTTLQPTAGPQSTTTYTLTVYDTLGCPKPGRDSVIVMVVPPVPANAGADQSVVINQPVHLNADGAGANGTYLWTPSLYLDNPNIEKPVAVFTGGIDTVIYKLKATTKEGCIGYDSLRIVVFETMPEIFVPSAFTPNGDGRNDIIKPTLAGIKNLTFFEIYNRWGNLLFSTSEEGRGWNGIYGGQQQPAGTYVYLARGRDFNGTIIERKGTIVLIR